MLKFLQALKTPQAKPPLSTAKSQLPAKAIAAMTSPAEKAARKRAAKALSNARQRCTNPKNPDYSNYGAIGVMVLFKTTDELIQEVGLPKPQETLDRIDPNGHYEPGNVRWASAALQAGNKKLSSSNFHLSEAGLILSAKEAAAQLDGRRNVAGSWCAARRAFLRGHFRPKEVELLLKLQSSAGALEAGLDVHTVVDWLNEPTFLHLPALSLPNARIRIRCQQSYGESDAHYLDRHGRWAILEMVDPLENVPSLLWSRAIDVLHPGQNGLILTGRPTPEALLGGWVEGSMLALASALARKGATTVFRPMITLAEELDSLGGSWTWDKVSHPILDALVLLVPDFSLDCGAWGNFPQNRWWKVAELLQYRLDRGLKCIIGVQSLTKLNPAVRDIALSAFRTLKMPMRAPHSLTPLKFSATTEFVPPHGSTLSSLANDPMTAHLVVHDGFPGT